MEFCAKRGGVLRIGEGTFVNAGASLTAATLVEIGRDCAIGNQCLIIDTDFHTVGDLHRVPEGKAVVAAGSVVTRDVEPYTIVGGVPARLIRRIEPG